MSNLSVTKLDHYRFWQIKLLVVAILTALASIEKYLFDFPNSEDWSFVMWTLHILTIVLAIKVLFFNINIKEAKVLYHSKVVLDQILENLQNENKEVQNRILVPLIQTMIKEPDEYGKVLVNIRNPGVLQMISDICSEEADKRLLKLAEHSSTAAQDAHVNLNSREIKTFADQIKQFERIKEYCNNAAL